MIKLWFLILNVLLKKVGWIVPLKGGTAIPEIAEFNCLKELLCIIKMKKKEINLP
jgi:hypothetical protein